MYVRRGTLFGPQHMHTLTHTHTHVHTLHTHQPKDTHRSKGTHTHIHTLTLSNRISARALATATRLLLLSCRTLPPVSIFLQARFTKLSFCVQTTSKCMSVCVCV
jgi:hypothetical protein